MGLLTLQFGQCGNQIGHSLFKYLINDISQTNLPVSKASNSEYINSTKDNWFNNCSSHYIPRSVLVDTENKVISSLINNNDNLKFNNIIAKNDGGSANNWAFGYFHKAEIIKDEVVETVRKEIEKTDDVIQIISLLSSGGGTGSGTGSRVLETLRHEFPNKTMINVIVLPYKNGEVVTQNYNTLLTLAKLYDTTDGSIIFENDSLLEICNSLLSVKNVDLHHMNDVIAQKICAVFQPAIDYSVQNFVYHLTSHPLFKFVQIKTTPLIATEHMKFEPTPTWLSLFGQICKVVNQTSASHYRKSVSNLLISRGGEKFDDNLYEPLCNKELYPSWVPKINRIKYFHQPRKLHESIKLLTLATNNNAIVTPLDAVINQAWNLFKHKAYLHQYLKHGVEETDFEVAFEKLESVINNYKRLK